MNLQIKMALGVGLLAVGLAGGAHAGLPIATGDGIEERCAHEYVGDAELRELCVRQQRRSLSMYRTRQHLFAGTDNGAMLARCTDKWTDSFGVDYDLAIACFNQNLFAMLDELEAMLSDGLPGQDVAEPCTDESQDRHGADLLIGSESTDRLGNL